METQQILTYVSTIIKFYPLKVPPLSPPVNRTTSQAYLLTHSSTNFVLYCSHAGRSCGLCCSV